MSKRIIALWKHKIAIAIEVDPNITFRRNYNDFELWDFVYPKEIVQHLLFSMKTFLLRLKLWYVLWRFLKFKSEIPMKLIELKKYKIPIAPPGHFECCVSCADASGAWAKTVECWHRLYKPKTLRWRSYRVKDENNGRPVYI